MKPNNILSMAYLFILIILISACATVAQRTTTTPTPTPATIPKLALTTTPTLTPMPATAPKLTATTTATPPPLAPTNTSPPTNPNPESYLEITLNKANLAPPVRELIYLTIDDSPDPTFDTLSRIWRADVADIQHATPIVTLTHRQGEFPVGLTVSPDGKFLIYGQHINKRTGLMDVSLLNLDNNTRQVIETDVARQIKSSEFLWSTDSQGIVFTKMSRDWEVATLQYYALQSGQTQVLLETELFITLVGWRDPLIYYIPGFAIKPPYTLYSYNLVTTEIHPVLSFAGENSTRYIRLSPDGTLGLFGVLVFDLATKKELTQLSFGPALWFPDSQGLLGLKSKKTNTPLMSQSLNQTVAEKLTLQIKQPAPPLELLAWSPDGQYLLYQNYNTSLYHLSNTHSGETQTFQRTIVLEPGGWIH